MAAWEGNNPNQNTVVKKVELTKTRVHENKNYEFDESEIQMGKHTWEPRARCSPLHCVHRNTPRVVDAQRGCAALQSAHILFPGSAANNFNCSYAARSSSVSSSAREGRGERSKSIDFRSPRSSLLLMATKGGRLSEARFCRIRNKVVCLLFTSMTLQSSDTLTTGKQALWKGTLNPL